MPRQLIVGMVEYMLALLLRTECEIVRVVIMQLAGEIRLTEGFSSGYGV